MRMEGGLGLPVLNSLAARMLAKAGFEGVTLSVEGDRRQFEEVTTFCPLPPPRCTCSVARYWWSRAASRWSAPD